VARLCPAPRVSRSGYYAWRNRPVSDHTAIDVALAAQVAAIHHHGQRAPRRAGSHRAPLRSGHRAEPGVVRRHHLRADL
jgi:hypothetical protein